MSATFDETVRALSENADLRSAVMSAGSAEERSAILRGAGVPVPSHADLNAAHAQMVDVDGGMSQTSTDLIAVGGVAMIAGGAAAGAA